MYAIIVADIFLQAYTDLVYSDTARSPILPLFFFS